MLESRAGRLVALCLLLGVLAVLAVWFGIPSPPDPQLGQTPTEDQLASAPDASVGQHVQVTGTVVRTDPAVVTTEYEYWSGDRYRTGQLEVTITGLTTTVTPGHTLQVYGVVQPDGTIDATTSVVVPPANRQYMYGISALAGLWVLARLVRDWTVDWDTLAVEQRSEQLVTLASLRGRIRPEDTTDA